MRCKNRVLKINGMRASSESVIKHGHIAENGTHIVVHHNDTTEMSKKLRIENRSRRLTEQRPGARIPLRRC
jgi:hypothetical protein